MRLSPYRALLLCLLSASFSACDRQGGGTADARAHAKPNVLLISLDTTRADRIGCYGHAHAKTPAIDELAAGGVRYANAFTHVPLTLPSHASLLTGLYPPSTGLHSNGVGALPSDVETLAERFQAAGYATGAFVGAYVLDSAFGLDRGFDRYDDLLSGPEGSNDLYQERRGDRVCDAALTWLAASSDERPFFAWVHFFDPHYPYAPPDEYVDKFDDPYDGEIAFTDAQIQRLLGWLVEKKVRDNTMVVLVGDHGEAFGEHGEVEHGLYLYQPTLHVPLITAWPGVLPMGRVVESPARLADIAPTILELVGLDAIEGQQGSPLAVEDTAGTISTEGVFCETLYPQLGFGWSPLRAMIEGGWKYVEAPRPELYDLQSDPREARNVIDENPQVASRLRQSLDALLDSLPQRHAGSADLSDEAMRTLRALGYVGSAKEGSATDPAGLRDPKDVAHVFAGFQKARRLIQANKVQEAYTLLKQLTAESPESEEISADLGEACLKLRRFEEAEAAFRQSLRTVPDNPRKLCRLGDAYLGLNDPDRAQQCYQKAVQASADYAEAHNRLGAIALRLDRLPQAREHFERYLALCPESAVAHSNLAGVLFRQKNVAGAIEQLRAALRCDAQYRPAHQMLCQFLIASRRRAEAMAALRAAVAALPSDTEFGRQLAGFLAMGDRGADPASINEAMMLAKRCCEAEPLVPENHDVLGIVCAAAGDFDGAFAAATEALRLARLQNKAAFAEQIARRRQAYGERRTDR